MAFLYWLMSLVDGCNHANVLSCISFERNILLIIKIAGIFIHELIVKQLSSTVYKNK